MKKIIASLALLSAMIIASSQVTLNIDLGIYHSNDYTLKLFEDSVFFMFHKNIVCGTYYMENNKIHIKPELPDACNNYCIVREFDTVPSFAEFYVTDQEGEPLEGVEIGVLKSVDGKLISLQFDDFFIMTDSNGYKRIDNWPNNAVETRLNRIDKDKVYIYHKMGKSYIINVEMQDKYYRRIYNNDVVLDINYSPKNKTIQLKEVQTFHRKTENLNESLKNEPEELKKRNLLLFSLAEKIRLLKARPLDSDAEFTKGSTVKEPMESRKVIPSKRTELKLSPSK